ncbi:KilA-N domain-containing protein [Aliiglaciecola lipolytica]|uniref:KilA-N domain-containing protein n=1 Tax=Aliiglaciecola lipolytica TaxID=477689 RepID=UPI001C0A25B2|nr:KilA-N domain-containing protein [Aliiglaciecola lipolytica]MBU2877589.1 KilA-N domain-containing protein [Aliiglaciecola lipolytica]
MKQEVTLTFNNTTATITSDDEGMLDLNDIWRAFDLKASQSPSQWRGKTKEHLASTANLQFIRGRNAKTLATLEALYAYAMWVDVEFYMVVVEAFAALTRGEPEEALETNSKPDSKSLTILTNTLVHND